MPNWCSTAYAIEGDAKEVKSLYELMKGLQERIRDNMARLPRGRFGRRLERGMVSGRLEHSAVRRKGVEILYHDSMVALQRDIRPRVPEVPLTPLFLSIGRAGYGRILDKRP